ncbi:MAG: hypothetical protein NC397_01850 [Clostridium sp.]|nr:hypothetical protein [Clostridium sp.]
MSNNNNDDIEKLLEEYRAQRKAKERNEIQPIEPPKPNRTLIDFSKPEPPREHTDNAITSENEQADSSKKETASKQKKKKAPKKTSEEKAQAKAAAKEKRKKTAKTVKKIVCSKKFYIPLIAIILAAAAILISISAVSNAKTAYLKPYQEKYPDVNFPVGILEQYCDDYGENPNLSGYIKINALGEELALSEKDTAPITDGASRYNYVVYMDTQELEQYYSTAEAYNNANKEIHFSDLFNDYTFQVVGAFYTNTKAKDDGGYIFPYNVTEQMTQRSADQFLDRMNTRIRYDVSGGKLTRQDLLLTISCPTDYKKDYRFIIVCKLVDQIDTTLTAEDKAKLRLTQSEYDELDKTNPYRFSGHWYPEIKITDKQGNETTVKKTIKDYE